MSADEGQPVGALWKRKGLSVISAQTYPTLLVPAFGNAKHFLSCFKLPLLVYIPLESC